MFDIAIGNGAKRQSPGHQMVQPINGASAPSTAASIDASSPAHANWRIDAAHPVIVNPAADPHALAAWACGEARDLELIASIDPESMSPLARLMTSRLPALVNVLEHLAEITLLGVEGEAA